MNYMQEIDTWLSTLLDGMPQEDLAQAKTEIKAKLLESYRNGQAAGGGRRQQYSGQKAGAPQSRGRWR